MTEKVENLYPTYRMKINVFFQLHDTLTYTVFEEDNIHLTPGTCLQHLWEDIFLEPRLICHGRPAAGRAQG